MAYLTESGLTNLVTKIKALVSAHKNETDNPHKVTKTQVGLENVENKSSSDIRSELTKDDVVTALGYTPGSSEDTNTTYELSKSGSTITLTGSDGSTTSVTDSNTISTAKVTGNGNAVTSISASNGVITATKETTFLTAHPTITKSTDTTSTATATHGGTITMIDGVTRDSNGHVTKINTKTVTLPSDNNTDTKVTQTVTTSDGSYPLLLAPNGQTTTKTTTSYFDSGVTLNPNTNTISANVSGSSASCTGNANTATIATKLGSSTVGSATQPMYLKEGTATKCTYTLGKSVPSNAVFTDTTYSVMTAATSTTDGASGLVPAPATGKQSSFLRGDGTWATPTNTKNTAGSTNSTAKLYLIGATSQASNPQTYSHDTAYVGTDGCLYSNGLRLLNEVNQTTEPTNQLVGDHWLVEY